MAGVFKGITRKLGAGIRSYLWRDEPVSAAESDQKLNLSADRPLTESEKRADGESTSNPLVQPLVVFG